MNDMQVAWGYMKNLFKDEQGKPYSEYVDSHLLFDKVMAELGNENVSQQEIVINVFETHLPLEDSDQEVLKLLADRLNDQLTPDVAGNAPPVSNFRVFPHANTIYTFYALYLERSRVH